MVAIPGTMASPAPSTEATLYWVWGALFILALWASLLDTRCTAKLLALPRGPSWSAGAPLTLLQVRQMMSGSHCM